MYQAEVHVTDAVGNESIATVLLDSKNGCGCSTGGGSTGATTPAPPDSASSWSCAAAAAADRIRRSLPFRPPGA